MLKYDPKINREKIYGILESDIQNLFKKLNLLDKFNAKQILCNSCNKVIDEQNFGAVYKENGKICFLCDKSECKKTMRGVK